MQNFITGKQAQLIIGITTRQGLYKFADRNNIETKSMGDGKPKLYNKEQILKVMENHKPKLKPETKKKVVKKREIVKKNIETNKKLIGPGPGANDQVQQIKPGKKAKSPGPNTRTKHQDQEKNSKITLDQMEDKNQVQEQNPDEYYLSKSILTQEGQKEFDRLREELIQNGTFEEKDISLLQAYCVSYQKYINAINRSAEFSDTVLDDFGNLKVHPYFQVADKCLTQMTKIATILGIGAKSRVPLDVKTDKKESIFDKIRSNKSEFSK